RTSPRSLKPAILTLCSLLGEGEGSERDARCRRHAQATVATPGCQVGGCGRKAGAPGQRTVIGAGRLIPRSGGGVARSLARGRRRAVRSPCSALHHPPDLSGRRGAPGGLRGVSVFARRGRMSTSPTGQNGQEAARRGPTYRCAVWGTGHMGRTL